MPPGWPDVRHVGRRLFPAPRSPRFPCSCPAPASECRRFSADWWCKSQIGSAIASALPATAERRTRSDGATVTRTRSKAARCRPSTIRISGSRRNTCGITAVVSQRSASGAAPRNATPRRSRRGTARGTAASDIETTCTDKFGLLATGDPPRRSPLQHRVRHSYGG